MDACDPAVTSGRRASVEIPPDDGGVDPIMDDDTALADRIDRLAEIEADADALVTVAVPPGGSLKDARDRVAADHEEAANQKKADTRDEGGECDEEPDAARTTGPPRGPGPALGRALEHLRSYDAVPETGLAVYAGVVDGQVVAESFDDLPAPVDGAVLTVSDAFDTRPLERAVGAAATDDRGLLVVERDRAVVGRYDGEAVTAQERLESDLRGKTREGDADVFVRDRDAQQAEFFDAVAATAERTLLASGTDPGRPAGGTERTGWDDDGDDAVEGVLLGGTEVALEQFRAGDHLPDRLADRVVDSATIEYATEQGLRALVDATDAGADGRREARDVLSGFLAAVGGVDPVAYGPDDVDDALTYNAVETLLLSEELDPSVASALDDRARDQGGDVVVVPAGTEAGERFRMALGGVGAHLRFPIE